MNTKTETTYKVFTSRGATDFPTYDAAIAAATKTAKSTRRAITVIADQHTPGYHDGIEVGRWTVDPKGQVA